MAEWILAVTGARPEEVAVAIETRHGPVVESLMARGFRLHDINPKQLDRFRDRFSTAGPKDDRRDAEVLASAFRTHPQGPPPPNTLDPNTGRASGRERVGQICTNTVGRAKLNTKK